MISTSLFPGRYVQGAGALDLVGEEASRLGQTPLVIIDPVADELRQSDIKTALADLDFAIERFQGECSQEEIDRLIELAADKASDVIIGVGGGKTLDTAKAVAHGFGVPVVIAPSLASTDAPCSALSVIYTPGGTFERYQLLPQNPEVVLVDSAFIAEAPARFLVSGMGDALATWFEAESCRINRAGNMTGRTGSMTAYALSRLCYDTLMEYGRTALTACEQDVVTPALEHIIEANTLLSGLGFESGGLASCHAIHNGLTTQAETHEYWHGEKVAVGVLASLFLTDQPSSLIDDVYEFCLDIGLPVTLEQIGLGSVTGAQLEDIAIAACAQGETIHNEPPDVSPRRVIWALKTADAEGARRLDMRRSAKPAATVAAE